MEYPAGERFTLQLLKEPGSQELQNYLAAFPNNMDAAFKRNTGLPLPSALLLRYSYGTAIIAQWGQHIYPLTNRTDIPRPISVDHQPSARPTSVHD